MDCFALMNDHKDDQAVPYIDILHQFSPKKKENEGVMMVINEQSLNSFKVSAGEHLRLKSIVSQNMYYGDSYNTVYKSSTGVCVPTGKGSSL